MRLTQQSDYALRMLMMLCANQQRLLTISEVAAHYSISKNHLMKVAQSLVHLAVVESVRGRGGGLRLARAPEHITIGEIIRPLEAHSPLVQCFARDPEKKDNAPACILTNGCSLKREFAIAEEQFFKALDKVSIADLVHNNSFMTRTLGEVAV